MATLTKDQQRQAFEESKIGHAAQQEIYADISSNYKAQSKFRYPGGAGSQSKDSDKIFFDPSITKVGFHANKNIAQQVTGNKNTFTDFFGFNSESLDDEPKTFSSLFEQQSLSYVEF